MIPEFKTNPRIQMLIDGFEEYLYPFDDGLRMRIYEETMAENAHLSAAKQIALSFARFLKEKEVDVHPFDLLAGQLHWYGYRTAMPLKPDFAQKEKNEQANIKNGNYEIYAAEREVANYLADNCLSEDSDEAKMLKLFLNGIDRGSVRRYNIAHNIAGYDRVLEYGFGGLAERGREALKCAKTEEQRDYIESMIICLEAASAYILRYSEAAKACALTADDEYKPTLIRIAEACANIAEQPPKSFFEAVQLIVFVQDILICESISGSVSIGRIDQYLYPYYKKDAEAGLIDFDEASVYVDAMWLKFAQLMQAFQNVTLGGCDAEGNFAGNDVTVMGLRASRKTKMDQPLVSFRVHKDMGEFMWDEVQDLIETGLGFPALFNDDMVFPSKIAAGISEEDVWNYGIVGCVEPSIGGKEYSNTEGLRLNWAKVLELMLSGGKCAITGDELPFAKTCCLDELDTFEKFYEKYKEALADTTRYAINCVNMMNSVYGAHYPVPFLSATMVGCFESGKDVSSGGSVYTLSSITSCGAADAVDSLMAIKTLVYDRKRVSLKDMADICAHDFEGHGELRLIAQNLSCRFGNDSPETDAMMRELTDIFHEATVTSPDAFGFKWQVGLYTVDSHAYMGQRTGTLPDGRMRGLALANGMSSCQGADRESPTAVVQSITKIDHSKCGNGLVLDMKFNPGFLKKETHRLGVRDLVRTYFELGGMEIQFNVVSRKTLLAAKANPQKYRNLVVRVSGYSAYFFQLDPSIQDEIIARTEYAG